MFKLIKIENSGINVPEPIAITKETDLRFCIGSAIVVIDGVARVCGCEDMPTYITYAKAEKGTDEVLCYRISHDMIFEVEINDAPSGYFKVGAMISLAEDPDGCVSLVDPTLEGRVEVIDTHGATEPGEKITVRF